MKIYGYAANGYSGSVVVVETQIRRGLPGTEIVGLPDSAVREARERVRAAIASCGFDYPADRILVNLAPGGVRKIGTAFDLPIACSILARSEQIYSHPDTRIMVLGELLLNGKVCPVNGALASVLAGREQGITHFIVPDKNRREASVVSECYIHGISDLKQLPAILSDPENKERYVPSDGTGGSDEKNEEKTAVAGLPFTQIRGASLLKRSLVIAAAGRHHAMLFGPPGCGKTMAANAVASILPPLSEEEAIETTRLWSLAGKLPEDSGLIEKPPFRAPHHDASSEGLIGGGTGMFPGEISLAHNGILFLDEAPEFKTRQLQALREPAESRRVIIARAGRSFAFPSDFQLLLAANPCPCGNLGRANSVCTCGRNEIYRYWRRIGGALLDRIDIRRPIPPLDPLELLNEEREPIAATVRKIRLAREIQAERYAGLSYRYNGRIPPAEIGRICPLDPSAAKTLAGAARHIALSARACHSILRVARTIADLERKEHIEESDILEAAQLRRYGDRDIFWRRF